MKFRLLSLFVAALACSLVLAQTVDEKPPKKRDASQPGTTPSAAKGTKVTPAPPTSSPLASPSPAGGGDAAKATPGANGQAGQKKTKGPTDITSGKLDFDQRGNLAIFTENVVVNSPDFNVTADKLTVHLKPEQKGGSGGGVAPPRGSPKPVTPKPAGGSPKPAAGGEPKKGGGLESAFAETTSERRVVVTQDKKDADGKVLIPKYSVGISDQANYNATTGGTILTGTPEVTQGSNRCIATDPKTKIYLTREGNMRTVGPHRAIIVDENDAEKAPTEITALESSLDQKANIAIFIGSVVVKNPEFNTICDKLTAYLKHEAKPAAGASATPGKGRPKIAASTPGATPAAGSPATNGGGLDKAVAVTTSERRVIITQDKKDAAGNIIARNYSIGKSDMAVYHSSTGDTVLTGNPDVVQGSDRCIATDPSTVITLNRDGHMKAIGPHRTVIVDQTEPIYSGSDVKVPKAVRRAESIVQAVLVDLGPKQTDVPGVVVYPGASFKLTKSMRGTPPDPLTFKLVVQDHDPVHELLPSVGTEYIVFIASEINQSQVALKILPSTEQNLTDVNTATSVNR